MSLPASPLVRWLPVATVAAAALAAALWLTVHPAIAALSPSADPADPAVGDRALAVRRSARPDAQAEFNRMVEFMAYAQAAQRFQALRAQRAATPAMPATPELQALARQLDGGLPERVARQEYSPDEAQALQAALREVLGTAAPLP